MATLFIGDLEEFNRVDLVKHIVDCYEVERADLAKCDFVVAYESVGDYGCDSVSFFVFRKKGVLYEVNAAHCSCYGFEGQWIPEETTVKALKFRAVNGRLFCPGCYDNNGGHGLDQAVKKICRMHG